jgi:hypothetical protein
MKIEKKEVKPVPPPPPVEYVLTLSHDQAVHLTSIVSNIGADGGVHGEFAAEWKTLCDLNDVLRSVWLNEFCIPGRMQSMRLRKQ